MSGPLPDLDLCHCRQKEFTVLKYVILTVGVVAFCITVPFIAIMPPDRILFGVLNPAEACLLFSVSSISLGLAMHAFSINPRRNALENVVKKYGDDWFRTHRLTRGIGLALGGLPHIAADVLGDEMESMGGGPMPTRTWTINEVLGKLRLRSIAGGDVDFVTAAASKKMEGPVLVWSVRLTLLDAQSADLFAKAVGEQTQH